MNITPLERWIAEDASIENSREALEKYQTEKIKEAIDYVKNNSKFYKEHLKDISTGTVKSLKNFESIPFTHSKDIVDFSDKFLCVPQKYVKRIVTLKTSGTTGDGKRVFFTEHDLNMTVDFFTHGFKAMLDERDKVMIMMPGNTYGSVGDIIKKSLDRLNVQSFVYGVLKDPDDAADFIAENNINALVALPAQIMFLSRVKKDVFVHNIEKLMLSADYVPEVLIKKLRTMCNCQVFTHYGLTETGYGCAVECSELNGYHIRENHIYLEVIDPETNQVLEDGNWGEIVITTLKRQAMPLIRYRTGDWGCFYTRKCQCKTFLKTLKRSRGRIDNRLCFEGNKHINMSEFDEAIFDYDSVLDYKIQASGNSIAAVLYLIDECMNDVDKIEESIRAIMIDKSIDADLVISVDKNINIAFSPNTMVKRHLRNKG
ncbi:MAG: DVU_1553 family AMP-dependent CoA ligase [Sedimentibacter sp.]|uniref:DVU_1553 family AMP-dependent CoA ligase n=1 Tax=Sedimentibacter sp. TaxID=1960295 RepID=UPI003158026B